MPCSATIPIRALATGKTCFIGQKDAFVDRVLRPVRQRFKAPEVVKAATGIVRFASRILGLGNDIEPEERNRAVLLLVSIRKDRRLKIAVGFPGGPAARRGFPVHDTGVPPILNHQIVLADQWLVQSWHFDFERLGNSLDRVAADFPRQADWR